MSGAPSRLKFVRLAAVAAGLVAIMLVCPGCSENDAAQRRDAAARPAVEPVSGGTFRLVTEAPASLDPILSQSVYEGLPVNQLFDGLVELDPSLHVKPALADTWTISPDGRTHRFHLRDGVTFHDGSELTAGDVVFTFKRPLSPGNAANSLAGSYAMTVSGAEEFSSGKAVDLSGVRALDDRTVEIELLYPSFYFLEVLSLDGLRIVPEKVIREIGEEAFGREPVGTGPFRMGRWLEDSLELTANPDYFRGAPFLDGIRIGFLPLSENVDYGLGQFLKGELDMVEPGTHKISGLKGCPGVSVRNYQELGLSFLGLGTGNPPLDRLEVRQAIAHAVNRDALVEASPEFRRPSIGLVPPGMNAYSPDPKALPYDPDLSRRLLQEAGYGPANPLPPISLLNTARSAAVLGTLASVREDLAQVGIRLDVRQVSWSELGEAITAGKAPMFLLAWVADLPDPDVFLRGLFESGGASNYFAFEDDEVGRLLELGVRERNPMKRSQLYRSLERRILSQAPVVPLYHTTGVLFHRQEVHGLDPGPLGISTFPLEKVWILEEEGGS